MKSSLSVAETAQSAEQVLLPSRYQQPFINAYQALTGVEVPQFEDRKASVLSQGILFRLLRGRDIPDITELLADPTTIGLTGSDWCAEYAAGAVNNTRIVWDRASEEKMGIVAVIAKASHNIAQARNMLERGFEPLRVVTVYPNLVSRLGAAGCTNIAVAKTVNGSVESVAEALRIPGVDMVSNEGRTTKVNNFVVVQELLSSYPAIVTIGQNEDGM